MMPENTRQRIFLVVGVAGLLVSMFFMAAGTWVHYHAGPRNDFQTRWCEANYVMKGVNPADVYFGRKPQIDAIGEPMVYPPWSYAYMAATVGWMPLPLARAVFVVLNLLAAVAIWRMAYAWSSGPAHDKYFGILGMGLALVNIAVLNCFNHMNYPVLVAALLGSMVVLLQEKRHWLAGCAWALAMVKPQLAVLLVIPLLVKRRFETLLVAGAIVLISTVVVSAWLHENPLLLLQQAKAAGEQYCSESSMGIFSFLLVLHLTSVQPALALTAAFGIAFTFFACWRYRGSRLEWLYWVGVCGAMGNVWTYVQVYNWIVAWPLLICAIVVYRERRRKADLIVLVILFLSLGLPRLLSLYPNPDFVAVHNLLRYGTWCFAIVYLGEASARGDWRGAGTSKGAAIGQPPPKPPAGNGITAAL